MSGKEKIRMYSVQREYREAMRFCKRHGDFLGQDSAECQEVQRGKPPVALALRE
jgi:hypothetical protein